MGDSEDKRRAIGEHVTEIRQEVAELWKEVSHLTYNFDTMQPGYSLVPRPAPQLLSLAVRKDTVRKKSCGVEPGNEATVNTNAVISCIFPVPTCHD